MRHASALLYEIARKRVGWQIDCGGDDLVVRGVWIWWSHRHEAAAFFCRPATICCYSLRAIYSRNITLRHKIFLYLLNIFGWGYSCVDNKYDATDNDVWGGQAMAPSVKIKDGAVLLPSRAVQLWRWLLAPYLWPNTGVLGSGRGHRHTRQGGAGAGAGWEDIYIILECMSPPCGCLHCTALRANRPAGRNIHDLRSVFSCE